MFRAPHDRADDDEPPARLPGVRRGRRVPPAGHDGDDRARLPALRRPQAHLPQPGPGPVRHARAEPLHHLLPLHALLQRLRRRPRLRRLRPAQPGVLRARAATARWRASSAATSSRSARPGCSTTRPWRSTTRASGTCRRRPAVCPHCGLGCNVTPGARYGELRRITQPLQPRRQQDVPLRPRALRLRLRQRAASGSAPRGWRGGRRCWRPAASSEPVEARRERALDAAAALLRGRRVIGIGSPRASLEANYALRTLVGPERFYLGMSDADHELVGAVLEIGRAAALRLGALADVQARRRRARARRGPHQHGADARPHGAHLAAAAARRRRRSACTSAAGTTPPSGAPSAASRARCGWRRRTRPSSTRSPREAWRAAPDDIARLALALAHELDPAAPRGRRT